jgi:hypothetical protein
MVSETAQPGFTKVSPRQGILARGDISLNLRAGCI